MPRRRANAGRKSKFRRHRRRNGSFRSFSRKVRAVLFRAAETKFKIVPLTSSVDATTDIELPFFSGLTQGVAANQRVGNQVRILRWGFNLKINYAGATAGFRSAQFRVMVLYPRKGVDTDTLLTTLSGSVPGINARPDPVLFMNLFDRWFILGGTDPLLFNGSNPSVQQVRFMKRGKFTLNYQNDNTVDREPVLYIATNLPAGNASGATVAGYYTVSFKDI